MATFRPLVLDYFESSHDVKQIHSLNVDSSKEFLFPTIFESAADKKFTSQFVDNRKAYYEEVKNLTADKDGLYYVVDSDEFLEQNIELLREQGIQPEQITLDKRQNQLAEFFPQVLLVIRLQ